MTQGATASRLCWKHPSLINQRKFARCTALSKYECSIDFMPLLQQVSCAEYGPIVQERRLK